MLAGRALEEGLLVNVTMDNIVRLLPALVIGEAEVRRLLSGLVLLIRDFLAQPAAAAAARA